MENNLKGSPIVIEDLTLGDDWDKTFPKSDKVNHRKATFANRYGITLAADVYEPKDRKDGELLPAIAVSGPFGAVKEQASGLYAQKMAENGFLAIAFDPSFTGESGGSPRHLASPEINTEDFQAAVDWLSTNGEADPEKIGIIGICGFGGMALNAAAVDPRIKATVTSTMYNMSRVNANGYFDEGDSAQARNKMRKMLADQRTADYKNGYYQRIGGFPDPMPEEAPQFQKDYFNYYRTDLGYSPRSQNSTEGWNITSNTPFINMPLDTYIDEIEAPVLQIHGENAHSRYFSEAAHEQMKQGPFPDNKELIIVPGANHTDLYYNLDKIPFDRITEFFRTNLK